MDGVLSEGGLHVLTAQKNRYYLARKIAIYLSCLCQQFPRSRASLVVLLAELALLFRMRKNKCSGTVIFFNDSGV